jgi:hypothetical protein
MPATPRLLCRVTMRNFLLVRWVYDLLYSMSYEISFTCCSGSLVTRVRPKAVKRSGRLALLDTTNHMCRGLFSAAVFPLMTKKLSTFRGTRRSLPVRGSPRCILYRTSTIHSTSQAYFFNVHSNYILSSLKVC